MVYISLSSLGAALSASRRVWERESLHEQRETLNKQFLQTMKKTLIAFMALAGVAAAQVTIDLTPTSISASVDSDGFSPTDVQALTLNSWVGTWENSSLANQVSAGADGLSLQIGAAASNNSGGNYAAVKFEAETPLTLSFDIKNTGSWGTNKASFTCEYTCTVYGFGTDGSSSVIGTWSDNIAGSSISETYEKSPGITLEKGDYTSYGIIFRSMETSTLANQAGVAMNISNIKVTAERLVPEPTTATLSLLALAGLAARRRRK